MTFPSDRLGTAGMGGAESGVAQAQMNVGNIERMASILAGAVGLLLLSRRLFVYVSLALISAYLVYRGVTGRCALYSRANINTRSQDELLAGASENMRSAGAAMADRIGADESEVGEIEHWMERKRSQDQVEEASWESFPASDPPDGGIA